MRSSPVWILLGGVGAGCTGLAYERRANSSQGDLEGTFKTVDEAALAGCNYIWKHEPTALQYEFCGTIYRSAEGIKATLPGTNGDATHCRPPPAPGGTTSEGFLHSDLQGGDFSGPDREIGRALSPLAIYLCTPGGLVKKMTPEGMVIVK